jgi:hypothetical protein
MKTASFPPWLQNIVSLPAPPFQGSRAPKRKPYFSCEDEEWYIPGSITGTKKLFLLKSSDPSLRPMS